MPQSTIIANNVPELPYTLRASWPTQVLIVVASLCGNLGIMGALKHAQEPRLVSLILGIAAGVLITGVAARSLKLTRVKVTATSVTTYSSVRGKARALSEGDVRYLYKLASGPWIGDRAIRREQRFVREALGDLDGRGRQALARALEAHAQVFA